MITVDRRRRPPRAPGRGRGADRRRSADRRQPARGGCTSRSRARRSSTPASRSRSWSPRPRRWPRTASSWSRSSSSRSSRCSTSRPRPGPARRWPASTSRRRGEGSDIGDAHAAVAAGGHRRGRGRCPTTCSAPRGWPTATSTRRWRPATSSSAAASRRRGCTRATSSPRPRPPGSSPTASSWSARSTQAPFATRDSLAKLFGLPAERIRVRSAPLGGAFGGKMMIIEPLVARRRAGAAPPGPRWR